MNGATIASGKLDYRRYTPGRTWRPKGARTSVITIHRGQYKDVDDHVKNLQGIRRLVRGVKRVARRFEESQDLGG